MRIALLSTGIALALLAAAAQAQMYRWVDQNGRVHYSDTPPPPSALKVEQKKLQASVVASDQLPYGTQLAAKNFPVKLYTSKDCGQPCGDGRNLLLKRGVPFKEVVVADEATRAELKRLSDDGIVPLLLVGRDTRKGFLAPDWHAALDAAGYPKSSPVTPRPQVRAPAQPAAQKEEQPAAPAGVEEAKEPQVP